MENNAEIVCRVCLRDQKDITGLEYYSIFHKIKEQTTVAHMINICCNLEVNENDGLPNTACKRCTEGLFIAYTIRKLVRDSDIKLRKTLQSNLETDEKLEKHVDPTFEIVNLTEDVNLELVKDEPIELASQIEDSEGSEIDISSDSCGSILDDSSNDEHFKDDQIKSSNNEDRSNPSPKQKRPTKRLKDRRKEQPYVHRCCICRTDFDSHESLENHSLDNHISEKSDDTSRPFECQICFKRYFTKSSLKRHRREIQKITGTRCCGCKKEFHTKAALLEHSIMVHLPKSKNDGMDEQSTLKYVCDVCYMRLATEMALSHHKTRIYLGKTYHCLKCDKSFMRKATLMSHDKRVHEKSLGSLLCSVCGTGFFDQSTLTNHEKTHVKEKPYECQVCMRTFASRTYLQTHMKIHTDPSENVPCPICEKIFRSTDLLTTHMNNTHNSNNLFQCNICMAKFKSVYYLKFHVRTHTGEKPYECEECKKTFAHKSGYRRHVRTHTGEKNFMCNFCGKGFSNRPNMLLHEKYHTGEKNSACDVCGKTFVHSKYMKRHRQRHFMKNQTTQIDDAMPN